MPDPSSSTSSDHAPPAVLLPGLTHSHDSFFRLVFSHRDLAAQLFGHYLPPDLAGACDWSTLQMLSANFIEDLRPSQADLLFEVRCRGRRLGLYTLLEHQSTVDYWMAHRLNGYAQKAQARFHSDTPDSRFLPPVYCMVVYQGTSPWNAPLSLAGLIDGADEGEIRSWLPDFRYHLVNLNSAATALAGLVQPLRSILELMVAVRRGARILKEYLEKTTAELVVLYADQDTQWLVEAMILYAMSQPLAMTEQEYTKMASQVLPEEKVQSIASAIYSRAFAEGEARGEARGELEGVNEAIVVMLRSRFGESAEQVEQPLRAIADRARLLALVPQAASASTLDEFLGLLGSRESRAR